jgi:energy-coupling factor transporter transmembrane protein EcfT
MFTYTVGKMQVPHDGYFIVCMVVAITFFLAWLSRKETSLLPKFAAAALCMIAVPTAYFISFSEPKYENVKVVGTFVEKSNGSVIYKIEGTNIPFKDHGYYYPEHGYFYKNATRK